MILRLFTVLLWCAVAVSVGAQTASAQTDCFPFDKLTPEKRERAEALLLKALDSEALYTLAADLKPMSSGFVSFNYAVREPRGMSPDEAAEVVRKLSGTDAPKTLSDEEKRRLATAESIVKRRDAVKSLDETREILSYFRCGDLFFADVHHFARSFDEKRYFDGVVFNRAALTRLLTERRDFFTRFGATPATHPLNVLYAIEHDTTGARFGGYGFLFGYPEHAVRFFVNAADEEDFTGRFVERDFYSIPTFSNSTNRFVYAVPKGFIETAVDRDLKARAVVILDDYKKRREQYIGAGKRGAAALLRDWLKETGRY